MNKRHKIILSSVILSSLLLTTWFAPVLFYITYKFYIIGVLGILAYILSAWSLWQGLNKLKAVVLMVLPVLFTLATANYFLLISARWLAIPAVFFYGIVFYFLLLCQNVFNVASTRTIPLYRVASTSVFVLTMITSFLLYTVIFSLNLSFIENGLAVFGLSFLLILQILWTIDMDNISKVIITYSIILSLIVGEVGLAVSFWPLFNPAFPLISLAALMLISCLFVCLGIATYSLRDRLSRGVVAEYVAWLVGIFALVTIITSWTG